MSTIIADDAAERTLGDAANLVLASCSPARRDLLTGAGVSFQVSPADLNESIIKEQMADRPPADIAMALAEAKALSVSAKPEHSTATCIGADQILVLGSRIFDKPADMAEARAALLELHGKTHRLISAVVLARNGQIIWQYSDTAELEMRDFSETFLDNYIENAGASILTSVGAYRLEGQGIQLFSRVDGAHTTILGLPMLPLLAALRSNGVLEA